jgi:hypothetical protein
MAIRIRDFGGIRVALCAAKTKPQKDDLYLDDADHYALARKFAVDCGLEGYRQTVEGLRMTEAETQEPENDD